MQTKIQFKAGDFLSWLREQPKQEAFCPCCNRYAKIYSYNIFSTLAVMLLRLYKQGGATKFIHVRDLLLDKTTGRQFSILKLWGLIAPRSNTDKTKRTSGYWRLTQKGVDFCEGNLTLPRVLVFDDKVVGETSVYIDIFTALGTEFNYEDLI